MSWVISSVWLLVCWSLLGTLVNATSYEDIFDIRGSLYNKAMSENQHARKQEIMPLLIALNLQPNDIVADIPAGGGMLMQSINDYIPTEFIESLKIIEIEPSAVFARSHGHPSVDTIRCNIQNITLPSETVTKCASLAGLHHLSLQEKQSFFHETFRILKPGGKIVVCDVGDKTNQDRFLNSFVDQYTTTGHEGVFFAEGELSEYLKKAGFVDIQETHEKYQWTFASLFKMLEFTRNLFALEKCSSLQQIHDALKEYQLEPRVTIVESSFSWGLRCAFGTKTSEDVSQLNRFIQSRSSAHLIEQQQNILKFSDFVRVIKQEEWVVNHEGLQATNKRSNEFLDARPLKTEDKNTEILEFFALVVSLEEDYVFVWNQKSMESVSIPKDYKLQTTPTDTRSYTLQKWILTQNQKLLSVASITKHAHLPKDLLPQLLNLLAKTDLNCYIANNSTECSTHNSEKWSKIKMTYY